MDFGSGFSDFWLSSKFNTARMRNQINRTIYDCYELETSDIKIKKVINNKFYLAIWTLNTSG
jgi:hypothetical protein